MRRRVLVAAVCAIGEILTLGAAGCGSSSSTPPPAPKDTWTKRASLPVARFESYGVSDGSRVWFLGGITGVFGDISTAAPSRRVDVYDPQTDTWTQGPDLPADAPKHHLAVAAIGARIYVLGGFDGILDQRPDEPFVPVAHAYVLDGGAWQPIASPPLARGAATAQAIDGKIYVTGGSTTEDVPPFDELDVYDTTTNAWTTGPKMPTAREHLASCAIDGKMIVVGGWIGPDNHASHVAEAFDTKTGAWTRLPDLPTARGGLEAIDLGDGVCHVIGGEDWYLPFPGTVSAHEGFDTKSGAWRTFAPMPTSRHGFGLARTPQGTLLAMGGGPAQGNSYSDVVEMYAP